MSGKDNKVKVIHGNIEVIGKVNKEIINNEIELKIAGCPTLQDGLDNYKGSNGSEKFKIMTQGRTIQEICDSFGYGCGVCEVSINLLKKLITIMLDKIYYVKCFIFKRMDLLILRIS